VRFKSSKFLGPGLKSWREEVLKESLEDVVNRGKVRSKNAYADAQQFRRFENGTSFPTIDRLIEDILPAYNIQYFDAFFLGHWSPRYHGLSEVRHLRAGDEISHQKQYGGTTRFGVGDAMFCGQVPVRIDRFIVPRGTKSDTIRHSGYNYLLVTKGEVSCELTEAETGGKGKSKCFDLKTGDALLFPTTLWHSIKAVGNNDAEFVVAVPTWAGEDLEKLH
jgi:quercetin dioxygenase-like cupin family protein